MNGFPPVLVHISTPIYNHYVFVLARLARPYTTKALLRRNSSGDYDYIPRTNYRSFIKANHLLRITFKSNSFEFYE